MKLQNATFLKGVVSEKQYPDTGYPEIALCGRSNVGKSSLINSMLQRKNLARTSGQPGKTQELNYYEVATDEGFFYLVDFPGYGFAKVSKKAREGWQKIIDAYLYQRVALCLVVQVVDIRHKPSSEDVAMLQKLMAAERPTLVVATKADKIAKGKVKQHLNEIAKAMDISVEAILPFSSLDKRGVEDLWATWESFMVDE